MESTSGQNPMSATDATQGKPSLSDPRRIEELLQKATAVHHSGDPRKALHMYEDILTVRPDHPDVLNLGGVAAHQLGDNERALRWLQAAANFQHDNPDVHYNLGLVLKDLDRLEDALAAWRHAVLLKPDHASAHSSVGNVLQLSGRDEEAENAYRRAIESNPRHANAHNNLGAVCQRLGKLEEALAAFRMATRLVPGNVFYWQDLAACLVQGAEVGPDWQLRTDLEDCLAHDGIDPVPLGKIVTRVLRRQPEIGRLLNSVEARPLESEHWTRGAIQTLDDPLLTRLLEKTPVEDVEIEGLLVAVRRALLSHAIHDRLTAVIDQEKFAFLCALARQCFLNEYVFFESEHEAAQVAELQARIRARSATTERLDPAWIALLATYRPLHAVDFSPLLDRNDPGIVHPLLEKVVVQQVKEPLEERAIRNRIPQITRITDGISRAVRAQYEENPYPRWVGVGTLEPRSTAGVMTAMFPHLKRREIAWPESPEVLVAGCGSGKHPIVTAQRFAGARVLAVDLSLSSLAYGIRRASEMGVANIQFAHGDLMAMGDLDRRFDIVECGGTLHHLEDPFEGWRILVGLLRADGLMAIGLYSELARRRVVAARAFIADHGYPSSPEGIRQCRKDLIALPDHSIAKQAIRFSDFFTISECRDLIFHVNEHQSNLLQIADSIDKLGLEFLGFLFNDESILRRYRDRFPEDPSATSLERWHRFELDNPDTFVSMYQFWVHKR